VYVKKSLIDKAPNVNSQKIDSNLTIAIFKKTYTDFINIEFVLIWHMKYYMLPITYKQGYDHL